uniref:Uncharacterized protein n=1 Tax=Anopheles culicifacies TaxID=139723 RepID=A0A182MTD7_9DIPT
MEYVPLRTPAAETYHYHHVTDQTKSLQDLQNEVAALLEFRDLVIETFPDLKSKMASSAANSTLTGLPSTSSLGSRREWEPGIRIRRKLTQKDVGCADVVGGSSISNGGNNSSTTIIPGTGDGGPSTSAGSSSAVTSNTSAANTNASDLNHHHAHHQQQHSSSSLIRSRSNSHSGKKEPKSGEGNNGSVIQDSGFSNETSSSKETHSAASSTSGAVQGTLILPTATNRLGTDAGGELWNLLDVIHRKSSRLREEVDQHLERERPRATNLAISHHTPVHHHPQHFPQGVGTGDNNIIIHHSNPATVSTAGATTLIANVPVTAATTASSSTTVVVSTGVPTAGKSLQRPHHLADGEQNRQQQQGVRSGSVTLTDGTDHNVQILRKERDRLLDKLSEYEAEMIAGRIQTAKMQDEVEKLTLTMRDLQKQLVLANNQKQELNSKLHDLANTQNVNRSASSSPETIKVRQQPTVSQQQQTSPQLLKTNVRYRKGSAGQQDDTDASGAELPYPILPGTETLTDGAVIDPRALGWLDGFLGAPWVQRVRSLDSQKIAAILLETNIVGLQRHLLTVTVQNQILQQRLDQATGSRTFLQEKLEKSKEDIDDLRFQLKEKSIELEGTKAQLRVIESKASSKSVPPSAVGSPERVVGSSSPPPASTMISTTSAHLHHHQHLTQLAMRLQSSQVSTPSMKAMTPVAMDDIAQLQQHSSSTESTQDHPERDSIGAGGSRLVHQNTLQQQQLHQQQPPETPRRRPSKIPLPGTKGSVAPKPPTGRNFSVTPTPTTPTTPAQRPLGGGASSGPPSNRSLTKSTGSLYVKSSDASSFGQQSSHQQTHQPPQPMARTRDTTSTSSGSLYRADSALSWRTSKDTPSLEKSRSSSIPVSAGKGTASGAPPSSPASTKASILVYGGAVCSSPQPRAKRDNLTNKVKNCDSLSRLQSAQVSTGHGATSGQLSKSGSRKELSSSPGSGISSGERKASIGGGIGGGGVLRHASTASIGSNGQSDESASATVATATGSSNTSTGNSNVKARRNNTFRLTKPTLTPLTISDHPPTLGIVSPPPLPGIAPSPDTYASSLKAVGRVRSHTATGSATQRTSNSSTISSVRPSCSTSALCDDAGPRDLIGEYLAAKNRAASTYQQSTIPPPIFHVSPDRQHMLVLQDQKQRQIDELAYKHPILLMDASEDDEEDERDHDLLPDSKSKQEEVDDAGEERNCGQESLIVPRPRMNAFQSMKEQQDNRPSGCRLVGKVKPNILKTWEQLSGGTGNACSHQRQPNRIRANVDGEHSTTVTGAMTTTTTTTTSGGSLEPTSNVTSERGSEADERQSCLLYCPQQQPYPYTLGDELFEFKVNRLKHPTDQQQPSSSRRAPSHVSSSNTNCTTATARNSSDGVDFYDSIDAVSTSVANTEDQQGDVGSYDDVAGGEALAELTSLDRKRLLWSIAIE